MYLLYIDESGTKDLYRKKDIGKEGNSRFFVMGAILIKAENLSELEIEVETIKQRYLKNSLTEVKTTLKNKDLKLGADRNLFYDELYSALSEAKLKCFGAQVDKISLATNKIIKSKDDVYKICFEHIIASVNKYLNYNEVNETVTVLIDHIDSSHNKKVYTAYKDALRSKSIHFVGFNGEKFSPSINFVDSEFTIGVQMADLVAGALWRGVEKGNKTNSRSIKKQFPLNSNNEMYGFSYCNCEQWQEK